MDYGASRSIQADVSEGKLELGCHRRRSILGQSDFDNKRHAIRRYKIGVNPTCETAFAASSSHNGEIKFQHFVFRVSSVLDNYVPMSLQNATADF